MIWVPVVEGIDRMHSKKKVKWLQSFKSVEAASYIPYGYERLRNRQSLTVVASRGIVELVSQSLQRAATILTHDHYCIGRQDE